MVYGRGFFNFCAYGYDGFYVLELGVKKVGMDFGIFVCFGFFGMV